MDDLPGGLFNLDSIVRDNSPQAKEVLFSYSRMLSKNRITEKNTDLCLQILSTNDIKAVDILIGEKDPLLLLSMVKPSKPVIMPVFSLLASFLPGVLYDKVLLACFGFLSKCYSSPEYGTGLYLPAKEDILHSAKFLVKGNSKTGDSIIEFLTILKEDDSIPKVLTAFLPEIISVYFDNVKKIDTIFPASLIKGADDGISRTEGTDTQA